MMTGVELWVKIYSPNVRGIEVVQRALKRARRARLFYMRFVLYFLIFSFNLSQSFYYELILVVFVVRSFAAKEEANADTFGGVN